MKIALVVHDIGKKRGHDRYVTELATALADRHEIHLFACTCEDIDRSRVTFHRVRAFMWPDLLKMLSFLINATWKLRKHRFDIIHTQGVCSLKHHITTAHFCQGRWQEVYRTLDQAHIAGIRKMYHKLVMFTMYYFERAMYRSKGTQHVIALSQQVKDDLIHYYGRPADMTTVIHNGINIDEFHPDNVHIYRDRLRAELDIASDTFVLLFVGEFQRKGLRYAIESLKKIQGTPQVLLVAAGDAASEPYFDLAQQLGVERHVRFVGHQADIKIFYAMSDAYVFPVHYEPFGFTITEAMATGIPVVTSAHAGAAEIIRDGEDGLLISDPQDAGEIARHIQRLIDDPVLRLKLGSQGRKRVEALDWRLFAEKVEAIYTSVIQETKYAE